MTSHRKRGVSDPGTDPRISALADAVGKGDHRAVARAISLAENGDPTFPPLLRRIFPQTGKSLVIGVTGARDELPKDLADFVKRVRGETEKNLSVWFGIGNGEQARMVAGLADGVIVGSALVKLAATSRKEMFELAREIRQGIDTAVPFNPGNAVPVS